MEITKWERQTTDIRPSIKTPIVSSLSFPRKRESTTGQVSILENAIDSCCCRNDRTRHKTEETRNKWLLSCETNVLLAVKQMTSSVKRGRELKDLNDHNALNGPNKVASNSRPEPFVSLEGKLRLRVSLRGFLQ